MREFCGFIDETGTFPKSGLIGGLIEKLTERVIKREYSGNGNCVTLELKGDVFDENLVGETVRALSDSLKIFLRKCEAKKGSRVLVVGVGNGDIESDSLGTRVVDLLSRHVGKGLLTFKPSVEGLTGIASTDMVRGVVNVATPDVVVVIDTLCTKKLYRLGASVQLTDVGLEPGGGVGNARGKLCEETLGIPTLAVGVPFVIYARDIFPEEGHGEENLIVTMKEVDLYVRKYAEFISSAIIDSMQICS